MFADIKIMDGGSIMADIAFQAGADMVSVLAQANDAAIQDVIKTAKKYHGKVLVDVCCKDIEARAKQIEPWGPTTFAYMLAMMCRIPVLILLRRLKAFSSEV
ncbi:MAG: orotidine 5'-phosphate decarboxylase / HUMPS family protein [Clostridium sp.]